MEVLLEQWLDQLKQQTAKDGGRDVQTTWNRWINSLEENMSYESFQRIFLIPQVTPEKDCENKEKGKIVKYFEELQSWLHEDFKEIILTSVVDRNIDGRLRVQQADQHVFRERFFFSLCPISLKSEDLKVCSACLSISYSGAEEQRADWKRHKPVCNVLKKLVVVSKGSGNATCVRLHPLSGRPEKNVEIQIKE